MSRMIIAYSVSGCADYYLFKRLYQALFRPFSSSDDGKKRENGVVHTKFR
ncbi:hypothetical protein HOLDEFILI_01742 [Holdemania filiformis DSM 12042]|uniref:Uncharacterized protein n=1 Tax=Holdemania filiformis DSM 12042 TaxID=545696 RepID=B9Y7E7_9FIRM|nr:hypothetical protein HOLDEFILI_01742 [Holdemania filiformis DSM 12042]